MLCFVFIQRRIGRFVWDIRKLIVCRFSCRNTFDIFIELAILPLSVQNVGKHRGTTMSSKAAPEFHEGVDIQGGAPQ